MAAAKRTTQVVHPDGTVSDRTSATKEYVFAVEVKELNHRHAEFVELEWEKLVEARARFRRASVEAKVRKYGNAASGYTYYLVDPEGVGGATGTDDDRKRGFRLTYKRPGEDVDRAEALTSGLASLNHAIDRASREIEELSAKPEVTYWVARWSESGKGANQGHSEFSRRLSAYWCSVKIVEAHEA
jgi:hypothetical protein